MTTLKTYIGTAIDLVAIALFLTFLHYVIGSPWPSQDDVATLIAVYALIEVNRARAISRDREEQ